MHELDLGEVSVSIDGDNVVFDSNNDERIHLQLTAENLKQILDFLSNLNQSGKQQRIGFRVPINKLDAATRESFHTYCTVEGQMTHLVVADLSLTGMLVSHQAPIELPIGSEMPVTMEFAGNSVSINGRIVRHLDDKRMALQFPESLDEDGELDPPDDLVVIFRALEHTWLKQRL